MKRAVLRMAVSALGLLVLSGAAGALEYQWTPGYDKMQRRDAPGKDGSRGPVDEHDGIEIHDPDEVEGRRQSFLTTLGETVSWLLKRHLTMFFIGLIAVSCVLMGAFRWLFSKYIPKPKFKAGLFITAGAFLVSVFGLAVVGLGVAVLMGRTLPELPVGSTQEAMGMLAVGAMIFVLGFLIAGGSRPAALLLLALLVLDLCRAFWLRGTQSGAHLMAAGRLVIEAAMVALAMVLAVTIARRWRRIMSGQSKRGRHV